MTNDLKGRDVTTWARLLGRIGPVVLILGLLPGQSDAGDRRAAATVTGAQYCYATAAALDAACRSQADADEAVANAICINISDARDRARCLFDADGASDDAEDLCVEQLAARRNACIALGQGRYEPDSDPDDFESDFHNLAHPNRYFPIGIGYRWNYGGHEDVTIEVLDRTKSINGLTCLVSRDRVSEDGVVTEDTNDWFAQHIDGTVFYCGEETAEFETFAGDDPMLPELVTNSGSFKWGRDGDKGGIIFPGSPRVGLVYREESSFANAEDIAQVISVNYAYGRNRDLDRLVPRALAERLCAAGDCVVTKNTSLLEPASIEYKYYARGIGFFLEVHPSSRNVLQLVNCNFDSRCVGLPTP